MVVEEVVDEGEGEGGGRDKQAWILEEPSLRHTTRSEVTPCLAER